MSKSNKFDELRKQAEALMPDHQEAIPEMTVHEIQSLFHELETHQVELELQNTELRERQKELEISRHEYSELFDFAPVGYVLINPEGTILKINLAGAELLGAERRYLIDMNFFRFIPSDFWHIYSSYQREVLNTLSPMTCELKIRKKDGTSFYAILKSIVIPNLGGIRIQIAILDIDEKKRAQEALEKSERTSRAMLDATHDSAVLMDTERNILAANRIFAEKFDTSENQLLGKNIRSITPPDVDALRNKKFQYVLRQKKRIQFKDERAGIILDNRLYPILDFHGNVTQVAAFSRDITQEEAMKNALLHRLAMEEMIVNVSSAFINIPSDRFDEIINNALKNIGEFVKSNRCFLFFLSDDDMIVSQMYEWCVPESESRVSALTGLDFTLFQWSIRQFMRHKIIYVPNVAALSEEANPEKERWKKWGIQGVLSFPLFSGQSLMGFFGFGSNQPKEWSEQDIQLLRILGDIFSNALMRIKDEKRLRKSEEKYRLLVENINEGIWRIDQNELTDFVNPAMAEMFGYTREEMLGRYLFSFMDDEEIAICKEKLERQKQGISEQHDFEFLKKDGSKIYTILNGTPLHDEKGNYAGSMAFVTDITERRQMEKLLQESEARYRTVVELQTEMICRFLPDTTLSFVNPAYCRYFGKKEDELIGHRFLPEAEHEKVSEYFASFTPEEYIKEHEYSIKTPDGEIRWQYWINRAIFDSENQIVAFQSVGRDITQRKNAEEARRKFEFIANSSKDFMTLINRDYRYEAANRTYRRYINKSRKEIVGRTVAEVWGEAVFNHHIRPNLDKCFAGEEIHFCGWIEFHKKGRGYYDVSYYPYFNDQKEVTHVAVFSLDNTERERVGESLQESETRFRNAFDYAAIGMALVSMEGRFLTVNQAVCKMFGYDEKGLVGKTFQEVTYPDDIHRGIELYNDFLSGLKNYGWMEKRYIHKKGHLIWASLSLSAVRDAHGDVSHFVAQIQDITSRKYAEDALRKSEQQLGSMLHAIGDYIVMIDKDFKIMWANETSKQIFGEDMIEKKCYEVYHEKRGTCCISDCHAFKSFQDGKLHEWETTIEILGEEKHFCCTANVALRDSKGNPVSVIKIARDITRQKIAEKKLVQAYEDLKNTQAQLIQSAKLASIGELAAGVAHELNQPLTVIRATSQLMLQSFLKKEDDPSPQTENEKRQIEMIEKHTGRMMTIINHLRIFSHQSNAKFEAVNINHVIEESLLMIGEQLRSHGILMKTELEPRLPKVYGNAIQLEQVFLNLFTNARDAIGSKRAEKKPDGQHLFIEKDFLEIVTRMDKYKKKKIEVLIKDSGCGIMEDRMNDIFDPFFTTKEVGKGTGLGLSISYGIIKDHGGKIEVFETGENGTTFRIILPVISK